MKDDLLVDDELFDLINSQIDKIENYENILISQETFIQTKELAREHNNEYRELYKSIRKMRTLSPWQKLKEFIYEVEELKHKTSK